MTSSILVKAWLTGALAILALTMVIAGWASAGWLAESGDNRSVVSDLKREKTLRLLAEARANIREHPDIAMDRALEAVAHHAGISGAPWGSVLMQAFDTSFESRSVLLGTPVTHIARSTRSDRRFETVACADGCVRVVPTSGTGVPPAKCHGRAKSLVSSRTRVLVTTHNRWSGTRLLSVDEGGPGEEVAVLEGVSNAVLSPDGARVAGLSAGGAVTVWRAEDGGAVRTADRPGARITALAWSAGRDEAARSLWVGRADGLIEQLSDSGQYRTVTNLRGGVVHLSPSPEGTTLLAANRATRTTPAAAVLIALDEEELVSVALPLPDPVPVRMSRWSADGSVVLVGRGPTRPPGAEEFAFSVHDSRTALEILQLNDDGDPRRRTRTAAALEPSGRYAVSAREDGVLELWDLEQAARSACWHAHNGRIHAVEPSSLPGHFVTGGEDGQLKFWTWQPKRHERAIPGESSKVASLAMLGSDVLAATDDGVHRVVRLGAVDSSEPAATVVDQYATHSTVVSTSISPDGRYSATCDLADHLHLFRHPKHSEVCEPIRHGDWIAGVGWSKDEVWTLTAAGHLHRFALDDGTPLLRTSMELTNPISAAIAVGEQWFCGTESGATVVLDADGQQLAHVDCAESKSKRPAALQRSLPADVEHLVHIDESSWATGSRAGRVRILAFENAEPLFDRRLHSGPVLDLGCHQNRLASVAADGIELIDLESFETDTVPRQRGEIEAATLGLVRFDVGTGATWAAATAHNDGTLWIRSLTDSSRSRSFDTDALRAGPCTCIQLAENYVITGMHDGTIAVWPLDAVTFVRARRQGKPR